MLARFAADRDEIAFAAIVERYGPMVLGVARRILRDCDAADDVFQATFLALVRSASTVRRPSGLPAWLHRTAYRAAVKLARRRRPVPLAAEQPATAIDPLDVLTARELLAAVDDEIRRLPAALQAAVIACGLEGRSQDEAAQLLGWTPGQVRGRLERGRRRLEERLSRRGLALTASGVLLLSPRPVLTAGIRNAAIQLGTGRMTAPRMVAALAASAGRTMPVRAVALVLGLAAVGLAGLAAGRPLHTAAPSPIPARVTPSSDGTLPEGALRRFGAAHYRVGDGPIALTPDGSSVVSVSPQGVVRILGAHTGRVIAEHSLPMTNKTFYTNSQAVLSADGSTAITGAWNGDGSGNTLTAWDLAAHRPLWARTNTNGVDTNYVALSANGKRLAVVEPSADWKQSSLRIVDFNSGETRLLANLAASIRRVLLSPDGKRVVLVTGGDDASAGACHDVDTGKKLWSIPRLARMLAFSTDGSILFATEKNTYTRVLVLECQHRQINGRREDARTDSRPRHPAAPVAGRPHRLARRHQDSRVHPVGLQGGEGTRRHSGILLFRRLPEPRGGLLARRQDAVHHHGPAPALGCRDRQASRPGRPRRRARRSGRGRSLLRGRSRGVFARN